MAIGRFQLVALDCADPDELADFYGALTGWPRRNPAWVEQEGATERWVQLGSDVGATMAFQRVDGYEPPTWPGGPRPAQLHVDIEVDDLDDAERQVLALGARAAGHQADPDAFRVYLDPAGHPFCLVLA